MEIKNKSEKVVAMKTHKLIIRILAGLVVHPLLLLIVLHRKYGRILTGVFIVSWLLLISLFLYGWFFCEPGLRKLYYACNYDSKEIRVVEGNDFKFHKKGYSESYQMDSEYYIKHRILLIPESKSIPVQYKFSGKMLVEFYDEKGLLLDSFEVSKPVKLFREEEDDYYDDYLIYRGKNSSFITSVFAFELGEIPFDLIRGKQERLKNMKIKITVLSPEEGLLEYCDSATLIVIPDLRL